MGHVRIPTRTVASAITFVVAAGALLTSQASASSWMEVSAPTPERSWTAEILYPVAARSGPAPTARVKTQLMHYTAYSRRRQVLMVTGTFQEPGGRKWVRLQLPTRPNLSDGWVPLSAVRLASTNVRVHVSIAKRQLELYRGGQLVKTWKVAVGKSSTPTTTGLFAVADPVRSSGHLGPQIIVLTAYSRVYHEFLGGPGVHAIHGWSNRADFGRAASNGCVRMGHAEVAQLAKMIKPGTPVDITAS